MQNEQVIIIGAGPCGMSCAIELQNAGIHPLIIEKGNVVNTIYQYPTHQTFFSSSDRLEIGEIPFITENQKPVRNQALAYYRNVAERRELRVHTYELVTSIKKDNETFQVKSVNERDEHITYTADQVIIATGYYDQPRYMGVPGEDLSKVMHYFKEAHPFYNKDVVVIGGKNSAVDTTLELHHAGANITVLYRGDHYSESIKPWILPQFDSLVRKQRVPMEFQAEVTEITKDEVHYTVQGEAKKIKNDFVFAMTGYRPNVDLLQEAGIHIDEETHTPCFNKETYETNIPGIYIAGVIASGDNNNAIFIENGRLHGQSIAQSIINK